MRTDGFASDRPGLRSAGAAGMGGLDERRGAGEQRPGEEEVGEFHEGDTSHVPYHPAPSEETGQVFFKKMRGSGTDTGTALKIAPATDGPGAFF